MIPKESRCRNSWLHRFNIVNQYEEGVMEICEICRTKRFFRVVQGKVNNMEYMRYHMRQALRPEHPLFYHEYEYQREQLAPFIYD